MREGLKYEDVLLHSSSSFMFHEGENYMVTIIQSNQWLQVHIQTQDSSALCIFKYKHDINFNLGYMLRL